MEYLQLELSFCVGGILFSIIAVLIVMHLMDKYHVQLDNQLHPKFFAVL